MMRSVSVISSHKFRWKEIDQLVNRIGGMTGMTEWVLARNDRRLEIVLGNEDLEDMFTPVQMAEMTRLLNRIPGGRLSVMFDEHPDGFEATMALGFAKAVAELWPTLLNDHLGEVSLVEPPK